MTIELTREEAESLEKLLLCHLEGGKHPELLKELGKDIDHHRTMNYQVLEKLRGRDA